MRKLVSFIALAVTVLGVVQSSHAAGAARFQVGVATVDIDPPRPQYLGGFGFADPVGDLAPGEHLQVRAMAIANATDLVAFAIVDTQGYFAGNQEGPWGSREARIEAAEQISALGTPITEANLIVSSTHSHAAPTIMGIWGTTDAAYLKQVYEGTVKALVDAASHLQPALLYAGKADVSTINVAGVSQTDGYQGWRPEGDLPVLWARSPDTGATIGLYANVPAHADIVEGIGDRDGCPCISADHIGVERRTLDRDLGGTAVVAMGTLGRQETIVQVRGLRAADRVGAYVSNEIERALANARPITDPTLRAAEQYVLVPATNPALAGLNTANRVADAATSAGADGIATHCVPGVDVCSIDRETLPPYAVGGAFGAWFTAFRIGDVVYATEPGEAFPEVSAGIRAAMNAPDVRVIGMAQDQLGYYYPPETFPFTEVNASDHQIYNSSLMLGEINVQAHALNAQALGFTPAFVHETNQFEDVDQFQHAGVQFYPVPREKVAGTDFVFDARWSGAARDDVTSAVALGEGPGFGQGPSKIVWDFGDGSTGESGEGQVHHVYANPGAYWVTATVTDPQDGTAHWWRNQVVVDPPLSANVRVDGSSAIAGATGGQGTIVAAHWSFDDGSTADGVRVAVPSTATGGSVVIVDGAGNTVGASF